MLLTAHGKRWFVIYANLCNPSTNLINNNNNKNLIKWAMDDSTLQHEGVSEKEYVRKLKEGLLVRGCDTVI